MKKEKKKEKKQRRKHEGEEHRKCHVTKQNCLILFTFSFLTFILSKWISISCFIIIHTYYL